MHWLAEQFTGDPGVTQSVLNVLLVLLGAGALIIGMRRRMPQPLRVAAEANFATEGGVKALAKRLEEAVRDAAAVRKEMHEMELRLSAAGEERAIKIHDRLGPIISEVHSLAGQVGEISKLLHELIQNLPRSARRL